MTDFEMSYERSKTGSGSSVRSLPELLTVQEDDIGASESFAMAPRLHSLKMIKKGWLDASGKA
jgi:hypothetical protein